MQIATSGSLLVQVSCPMEDKGSAGKVDICLLSDKPPTSECGPFCSLSCCLKQREFSDERMERNTGQLGCGEKRAAPNLPRARFIFFCVCSCAPLSSFCLLLCIRLVATFLIGSSSWPLLHSFPFLCLFDPVAPRSQSSTLAFLRCIRTVQLQLAYSVCQLVGLSASHCFLFRRSSDLSPSTCPNPL